MPFGAAITFTWEKARVKRMLRKFAKMKTSHNRALKPAVSAGMAVTAREIRKAIPAYIPKRASPDDARTSSGRKRSRLWEAKRAVGSKAKVKSKGYIVGRAGSGVGRPRSAESSAKGIRRAGRKGVGIATSTTLKWYLKGTKKRHTDNGTYTGRMRNTRLIPRVWARTKGRAMKRVRERLVVNIRKEWRRSTP